MIAAAMLAACASTAAPAQDWAAQAQASTQAPPAKPPDCVESTARFRPAKTYTIESNRCERHVRCTVSA
jgi:hypothetical protein